MLPGPGPLSISIPTYVTANIVSHAQMRIHWFRPGFEIYTVLKEDDIKNVQAIAFFSYLFEPKYFTGAITRLWRFV